MGNPWHGIGIAECGEKLVMLDAARVAFVDPHPYQALGAVYADGMSPFMLRSGVAERLYKAQELLQQKHPRYRFMIFDGLRPLNVQQQMVDLALEEFAAREDKKATELSDKDRARLMKDVLVFWSMPTDDPARPPLHSTGGAVDLTILDDVGQPLDMGTVFDHLGAESATAHFAQTNAAVHANRQLLLGVMLAAGFTNYENEWWHYDYGTQRWAMTLRRDGQDPQAIACYGRALSIN